MNMRLLCAALIATTAAALTSTAHAQTMTAQPLPQVQAAPPAASGRLTARTIDLHPIPSRISHGVVSVRNIGTSASVPSVITVNCHRPGQAGGCADIPAQYLAQYTDAAYPNRLVVQTPVIQPGTSFRYTSGCPLGTPSGIMVGSYQMTTESGELFNVVVPAFSLDSPHARRSLN